MNNKCAICHNDKYKQLFEVEACDIKQCTKCELVKTFGVKKSITTDYHRDYDYKKYESEFANIFKLRFNRIKSFKKDGKVLEIGCSTGLLLDLFQKDNWEAWGVEPSGSSKIAKKRGIKIIKQKFENANLKANYFDVVILNHTLEHIDCPFKFLKKISRVLKKGGVLYVDVPNFGSWDRVVRQMYWPYLLPDEHIHHFTYKTLKKLVNKTGFKVVKNYNRSGLFDVSNPMLKLYLDFIHRPIAFVNDVLDFPGNLVTTIFNKGNSLSIIAVK